MALDLADVPTLRRVRKLADVRTYARGETYFHDGAVGLLGGDAFEVSADVQGTQRYQVRLAAGTGDELEYECDCRVGDDGVFCKHAVAVALSWLENAGEKTELHQAARDAGVISHPSQMKKPSFGRSKAIGSGVSRRDAHRGRIAGGRATSALASAPPSGELRA